MNGVDDEPLTAEQAALVDRSEVTNGMLTEEQEIYKENIIDHYKNPRNKVALPACTICQNNVNPLCGDQITMYFDIQGGMIQQLSFTGQGCAISQAAASMLTEEFHGKTLAEVQSFTLENMLKLLGIPISPARKKCAFLALTTIHQGVQSWRLK